MQQAEVAAKKGLSFPVFVLRTGELEKKYTATTMPPKRKSGPGKVRACRHILLVCCARRCLLMQAGFDLDIDEGDYEGVRVLSAFYRHADEGQTGRKRIRSNVGCLCALHVVFLIANVSAFDHMNAFLKCISATRSCECLPVLIALRIVNLRSSSSTASGG